MVLVAKPPATNAVAEIVDWCKELSTWQQDALRRIVEKCDLTSDDIGELTALCMHSHGVDVESVPECRPLDRDSIPKGPPAGGTVTLQSIAEPENVNAIEKSQELTFDGTGLTVIFGYNGAGKSGYGRILRRACRSRSTGSPILPHMLRGKSTTHASAVITYALNGTPQKPEQWIDELRPIEALGSVSFFDSSCAAVHVREKHSIAFTPVGLDLLPKLGQACKDVQKQLDSERKKLEGVRPKFLQSPQATGNTAVGRLLKSLTDTTVIAAIDALASLSDAERQQLKDLPAQLANDPAKQAAELKNRARRVGALARTVRLAADALSDDAIAHLRDLATDLAHKSAAADAAASVSFSGEPLPGIGELAWRELWEAARRFSTLAIPGRDFPVVAGGSAVCVLCQQPLGADAKDRMQRFDRFIRDDTAAQAATARQALNAAAAKIDALPLRDHVIREQLEELELTNVPLKDRARLAIAVLLRRWKAVRAAKAANNWGLVGLVPLTSLDKLADELEAFALAQEKAAKEIELADNAEERRKLEAKLAELKAREWLASVGADVKEHVTRLAEIKKLNACIDDTKTNKITAKSKLLAKTYATDQLRNAFASEIKRMQQGTRRLNVELAEAAGAFGSSYYKIQLVGAHDAAVEAIVSEGEHRCIALAGFLSDLATQHSHSAIVFDDPVNSLDHHWRECFAHRLVDEAQQRQVIVFTHDIVFLHDLVSLAADAELPVGLRRIQANHEHSGMVSDGLPWIAQKTMPRIDDLEKDTRATQADYDAGNDKVYEPAIRHIYDQLRATVERAVEEWVFRGVVQRHRDYISLKDLRYVTVLTGPDCERLQKLFQRCCDITGAHDRSSMRSFAVPRPDEALTDLAELRSIIVDIRARQKAIP